MTQKDHFNALAAAVVAAYQKESAAPAALVEKYSAMLDQAKATAKAARLAWDTAEEKARKISIHAPLAGCDSLKKVLVYILLHVTLIANPK